MAQARLTEIVSAAFARPAARPARPAVLESLRAGGGGHPCLPPLRVASCSSSFWTCRAICHQWSTSLARIPVAGGGGATFGARSPAFLRARTRECAHARSATAGWAQAPQIGRSAAEGKDTRGRSLPETGARRHVTAPLARLPHRILPRGTPTPCPASAAVALPVSFRAQAVEPRWRPRHHRQRPALCCREQDVL